MTDKQWLFPKIQKGGDIYRHILEARGIVSDEDKEEFLSAQPRLTHDPFLMKNMEKVCCRILSAIDKHEKICIYGDYDADGICSVSLLMDIFQKLGADIFYYIPSRFEEGYGLNKDAIDTIIDRGAGLIVTVDCGVAALEEVAYAKTRGFEIIVTDHHNVGEKKPDTLVINPKQVDCEYPEKNLSGCGVAFKLAQALQRRRPDILTKSDLNKVLDLVAIATIGDIVPLLGENRTLIKYGMKNLAEGRRVGLAALLKQIGLSGETLKAEQVAYGIVPYLNAAGRMFSADLAVELLVTENEEHAAELAISLADHNQDRKNKQSNALKDALEALESREDDYKFIMLKLEEAHEGVTGIVAGKIKDLYNLPAIIFSPIGKGRLKGTGRSITGLNLYEMLLPYSNLYEKFGGHEGACGLTMKADHYKDLEEKLQQKATMMFDADPDLFVYKLVIEGCISRENDLWKLANELEKLEPFGQGNPKPLLALKSAVISSPVYMGEDGRHVKFQADRMSCIFFGGSERVKQFYEDGNPVDLVGYLEINRWNGEEKLQFMVEEIRYSESTY